MKTPSRLLGILAILVLVVVAGCGGGDGSSGPSGSAAGTWTVTETLGTNTCGASGSETYTITITQNGSSITVATPSGTFTGSINGSTVHWTGSYPDQGGTTTITSLTATVSGDSFSGSSNWSWTDGSSTCSGRSTFAGTKV